MLTDRVVIPVAGLGTRLLTATKEQPKEMLPIFARDQKGNLCLKPVVELIFGQLFEFGARSFCFVVGRDKRAIEDHFTPDYDFLKQLNHRGRTIQANQLEAFYEQQKGSAIMWVNQPEPLGFGHAVLVARSLVGDGVFLVHAGDTYITSVGSSVLERLTAEYAAGSVDAVLTLQEVQDTRQYGVAEVTELEKGVLKVRGVLEKPEKPRSKLAIMPLYIFNSSIFDAIEGTRPDKGGEIQLTDAIQLLIESGHGVRAIKLRKDDVRLEVGTPESYWEALKVSYNNAFSCK